MARRKNTKRIDPRYFLNETVNRLDEREGETAEDVAARLKNMPASFRGSAVNDFLNMRDGSREMARHYPHVQDLVAFASDVLELLGDEVLEEQYNRPGRKQMAAQKDKLYNTMGVVRRELHDLIKLHRQEKYRKDPQTKPTLEILRNLMDNITREYTQDFPPRDGNEE
jgi:hypothetical protein